MNRMILKYAYPLTIVILAVLAWAVYKQIVKGGDLITYFAEIIIVWIIGTFLFIYFWPSMTYSAYKRAILQDGMGGVPIPVNTLYAVPNRSSPAATNASMLATGTDDVLYFGGWLDLSQGSQVLHVPEMDERYYSVQFTDPKDGADFAYVGTRTTGTQAGDFLVSGPGWKGSVPQGMQQISTPNNAVLVLGRAQVVSDNDVAACYALTKQFQLTPVSQWKNEQ
jgi:hypothetical protein